MKDEPYIDRLSEYFDGGLDALAKRELEAHLAGCAECRAVAEDFRRLTAAARELPPAPPSQDLWPAIAARLADEAGGDRPAVPTLGHPNASWWRRRLVLSWPQATAAAAAVAAVTLAGAWWMARSPLPASPTGTLLSAHSESLAANSDAAYLTLASEVQTLRGRLDDESGRLDPETVRVLHKNLRLIDDAITQSRSALASDPAYADETGRFVASISGKLELLRQATDVALAQANGG